jgi:integrase/recombinase XerD
MPQSRPPSKPIADEIPTSKSVLEDLLESHLEGLAVRHYSQQTIKTRRDQLGLFVSWCVGQGVGDPQHITRAILERYQYHLFQYRKRNGQPLSLRTQHGMLVPVRGWFRWLTRENYLLRNPALELELPRIGRQLPRHVLSVEEVERVLQQPNLFNPLGLRDRAILETLYSSGIRRGECVRLKLYEADLHNGTMFIRQGKGKKDRVVPIGNRAIMWIQRYLLEVRPRLTYAPDDMTLFLSRYGGAISRDHLSGIVHSYIKDANLGKLGGPHLLRHTMATLMLDNGAGLRFLQEMLGHETIATTQIYTHVSIRQLKQVHEHTHPAETSNGTAAARRMVSVSRLREF